MERVEEIQGESEGVSATEGGREVKKHIGRYIKVQRGNEKQREREGGVREER